MKPTGGWLIQLRPDATSARESYRADVPTRPRVESGVVFLAIIWTHRQLEDHATPYPVNSIGAQATVLLSLGCPGAAGRRVQIFEKTEEIGYLSPE